MRLPWLLLLTWALLRARPSFAGEPPASASEPQRLERLRGLAELWGEVRYRHPMLAAQDFDWDASLLAGADGDITDFCLPGGGMFLFSGAEVRHVGGQQLQCLGLQPHLRVRPTLEALRAGRDEVLEAALRLLEAPLPSTLPQQ